MSQPLDINRILDVWLDDGPTSASDRILDVVADRIERQHQCPAWRLDWRRYAMNINVKIVAALVAVLAVAIVGYNMLPDSSTGVGGPASSPSASPSPSTTATVAPSPTQAWVSAGPCGDAGCAGPQSPGTYTSRSLNPAVRYTLASDWVTSRDWSTFFLMYPDSPTNRTHATTDEVLPYIRVLPGPTTVSPSRGCVEVATDFVKANAAKVGEYLAGQEFLVTAEPVPVTVGGLTGLQFDITPKDGWTGCLPGQPLGETVTTTDRYGFIVLDQADGNALFVRLRAPSLRSASEWQAFLTQAMPVVDSFEFDFTP